MEQFARMLAEACELALCSNKSRSNAYLDIYLLLLHRYVLQQEIAGCFINPLDGNMFRTFW